MLIVTRFDKGCAAARHRRLCPHGWRDPSEINAGTLFLAFSYIVQVSAPALPVL